MATWNSQFRCVTTSLRGYGETSERRTAGDPDISREAEILESVIRKADGRVHRVVRSAPLELTLPVEILVLRSVQGAQKLKLTYERRYVSATVPRPRVALQFIQRRDSAGRAVFRPRASRRPVRSEHQRCHISRYAASTARQ